MDEPDHIKEFLIHTSILKQMCTDICNFMLGIEDSHLILKELLRLNLFVMPLDNTSTWYRYHHLFAKLLQRNLKSKSKEDLCNLHRAAAEWYLSHKMTEDAIDHLLEARDYDSVIHHIEKIIDEILGKAKFGIYLQWLNRIPDTYFLDNPIVVLHQAFFLYEMGQFEKCYQRLTFVEKILGPETDTYLPDSEAGALNYGCLNSIKGVIHVSQGEIEKAFEYASRALVLLPEGPLFWRVLSLTTISFCQRIMRNYDEAIKKISAALELASEAGFIFLCFVSTSILSKLQLERVLLYAAIDTCQKALDQDVLADYKIPFTGSVYLFMGELLFLSGNVEAAEKHISRGLEKVTTAGAIFSISWGHYLLASIYVNRGESESALLTMDRLHGTIEPLSPSATAIKISNAYQVQIQILCNQFELAQEWARQPDIDQLEGKTFPKIIRLPYQGVYRSAQEPLSHHVDFIRYTLARLELIFGHAEKAHLIVDRAIESAERKGRILQTSRLLILKSLILEKQKQSKKAVDTFLDLIQLIDPREVIQIFIQEGTPLLALVQRAYKLLKSKNGSSNSSVDEKSLSSIEFILNRMHSEVEKTSSRVDRKKGPDTYFELTPRELEVLASLSRGFSYEETAAHLYISKNTIKSHLKRIYDKLEVDNRLQAVNKAKKMGLIY
ncbi:LuxR C-terminal-related transcriptional regulator [Thermodesulfobacteriota bacterium]